MVPTYWESFRIGWTILWRGTGSVMLVLMLLNWLIIAGMPELSRASPSWGVVFFPFALSALIGAFGIMRLLRPSPARPRLPTRQELDEAQGLVARGTLPSTYSNRGPSLVISATMATDIPSWVSVSRPSACSAEEESNWRLTDSVMASPARTRCVR